MNRRGFCPMPGLRESRESDTLFDSPLLTTAPSPAMPHLHTPSLHTYKASQHRLLPQQSTI
ncbi:hypothetical protein E2C01_019727 [Portunus trituberculatus]|uniref:Uncharacterized protein n=1 Tax=Portunus trituberculatus TaxID=210409 RepID=A0A5B7DZG0_PORTR|nr:hypothetical protein [Portunus trituberculatus]